MSHRPGAVVLTTMLSVTPFAFATTPTNAPAAAPAGCFSVGGGYLRARIRGAMNLDLNWKNAEMTCEGGPRPSGNGMRVSIGGPLRSGDRRIRLVFGIAGVAEGAGGTALRTN